jgi:hypothetical protein
MCEMVSETLRDPDSEEVVSLEVGAVQCVNVGAQRCPDRAGQRMTIRDGGEGVQLRLERCDSLGFNGRFVHEAPVEIADLASILARRSAGLCRILDQRQSTLPGFVGQDSEDAVTGLVGGDGCRLDPSAIRVSVEIVAGRDGFVHSSQIEARLLRRWLPGTRRHGSKNQSEQQSGSPGVSHSMRLA